MIEPKKRSRRDFSMGSLISFENKGRSGLRQLKRPPIGSFQHGVLESRLTWMFPEASLRTWMPAIHAGMTKIRVFMFCGRA
jgi:hypothetical protein